MNTIKLTPDWDIMLNDDGNIEVVDGDYAIAQTCANAIRLFTNDAYYDRQRGIPHFDIELGEPAMASMTVLKNRITKACMNVEGVTGCEVTLSIDKGNRLESGEVTLNTVNGTSVTIEI